MSAPSNGITFTGEAAPQRSGVRPGRGLRAPARILVGVTAAAVALVSSGAVTQATGFALPAVTGPSPVGRAELSLTDSSRIDPFATDGRSRELAVWIWYPAVAGSTGPAAPYCRRHGRTSPTASGSSPRT
jgi:hypothetical protein